MRRNIGIVLFMCFILLLASCSIDKNEIKNTKLNEDDLSTIIENNRTDSENSLYLLVKGTEDNTLIENLGVNKNLITSSVISIGDINQAYCIAILETSNTEDVIKSCKKYMEKRIEELYIKHYDDSLIAENSSIRTIYDYVIFVMGENSSDMCESIENELITVIETD